MAIEAIQTEFNKGALLVRRSVANRTMSVKRARRMLWAMADDVVDGYLQWLEDYMRRSVRHEAELDALEERERERRESKV